MSTTRKTAEKAILEIVKSYEELTGYKVDWVDITCKNHVGFHHDGSRPVKTPKPSKATIKGELK